MDGFDDLLAPSRQILEDNPFADPFAKRSNSPDPWATPFASQPSASDGIGDADEATTPTTEAFSIPSDPYGQSSNDPVSPSAELHAESPAAGLSDPLDLANAALDDDDEEEDNKPLGKRSMSPRSPGFRESIPSSFSEIATIRPTEPEELPVDNSILPTQPQRSRTPPPPGAETPVSSTYSAPQPKYHSKSFEQSGSSRLDSPSPSSTSNSRVVSPLAQHTPVGINNSISGLTQAGEILGGWQSEQTAWGGAEHTPPRVVAQSEDDSDDDKPIGSMLYQGESKPSEQSPQARRDNGIPPVFSITVDDPQKVGDPIRSFTMYTVHTRTTSPLFAKSAFSVLRRYSDFLWLYETLSINNPGVVVPPVPEKNPFGRFDDHFVRQRRFALEKCIQKIANHPVLSKDADLKTFLESDSFALDIKHRKAEIAHERGGLMASIGQTIAGPRFYETDEWFDRQKGYLDSLESQLRGLVKAIEIVAKHRSELAIATAEFAQTAQELSESDVGKQLSQSLAGLADVERKAQDLQNKQSEQDMVTLNGTVDEYARLINSVRLAFNSRIRTYHGWKNAESELLKVKQTHERNKAQGRIPTERLGHSLSQIAEAERRALDSKHEYEHCSKLIKSEVARFERERVEDFKDSLHAFLEGMISSQKELIAGWENYQHMLLARVGGGRGLQNASTTSVAAS